MPERPRVTVLGSLNTDISVTVPRLPGPGETVLGGAAVIGSGGKGANQAVAAARLGASVRMTGCVGDDDFGRRLAEGLAAEGVDITGVRAVGGVTSGVALISVDPAGENTIAVSPGANALAGPQEVTAAFAAPCDVLVLSAEIPVTTLAAALARARAEGVTSVLNLAPAPGGARGLVAAGVDWLVVNAPEAAAVLGRPVTGRPSRRPGHDGDAGSGADGDAAGGADRDMESGVDGDPERGADTDMDRGADRTAGPAPGGALAAAAAELAAAGARFAVITLGAAGAVLAAGPVRPDPEEAAGGAAGGSAWDGRPVLVPGFAVTAVDSVGAGDAFAGALAVALAGGAGPVAAVRAACAAGAAAVTRRGAQDALPSPADVRAVTGQDEWPQFRDRGLPVPGGPR